MKAKSIQLTGKERIMMQAMIRMKIESNKECEKRGIKPACDTETLKRIYEKIAGYKYEEELI